MTASRPVDRRFMLHALKLAGQGMGTASPNPMVGAVLVRDGRILGEGYHERCGGPHAEIAALQDAARRGNPVKGADLYVTLEPCCTAGRTPPCTDAILRAGIARVIAGCTDPNPKHAGRGFELLCASGVEVVEKVLEKRCIERNKAFFCHVTEHRPYVLLKMAQTLDGKIATAGGCSRWITGPAARRRVQELRLWADAVLVGGETVRQDHPRLTARQEDGTPAEHRLLRFVASRRMSQREIGGYFDPPAPERVCAETPEAWREFLLELGRRNVTALLVEGGGKLAWELLRQDLVDEVEFHVAPKLLGGGARSVTGTGVLDRLEDACLLGPWTVRRLGPDVALSAKVLKQRRDH